MTGKHTYDSDFIRYTASSSNYSARTITSLLAPVLRPRSVLDVGCAAGTWLRAWSEAGVDDIQGVDGDYVDRTALEIPKERFAARDLNARFDLARTFDLVQSLEVAEHICPSASEDFVASIAAHAKRFVLFSAAPPGQGGEYHINEQPYDFWRRKFERQCFVAIDAVRPMVLNDTGISYWYRYNIILFARPEAMADLPPHAHSRRLALGSAVPDVSPAIFKARKAIVRRLPWGIQHNIARLKARFFPTGRF